MIKYEVYAGSELIYDSSSYENSGIESIKLDLEINTPGTFSFTLKGSHPENGIIKPYTTLIAVRFEYTDVDVQREPISDNYWAFVGRVTNISTDIYGNATYDCEGAPSFLNDVYVPFEDNMYATIENLLSTVASVYNTAVGTPSNRVITYNSNGSQGTDTAFVLPRNYGESDDVQVSYSRGLDLITEKILDQYSAMLYFAYDYDVENATPSISFAFIKNLNPGLSYDKKYNNSAPDVESIIDPNTAYGTYPCFGLNDNILAFSKERIKRDVYSGIMPVGKNGVTPGIVWSSSAIQSCGRIVKLVEFSELTDTSKLESLGQEYLERFGGDYGEKYTVTGIEPCVLMNTLTHHKLTRIGFVTVVQDSVSGGVVAPLLAMRIDLFDVQNNEYVIGAYVPQATLNEDITAI